MQSAAIAALIGCLLCYPRLAHWSNRSYPIWYLEATLLLGGFVLWALVFAWHTEYTHRPVITLKLEPVPYILATLAAVVVAFLLLRVVDPPLRIRFPEDYPSTFQQWSAMTLFSLGFTKLFLIYAPFAWSLRLCKREWMAILLTVLFGVCVVVIQTHSLPKPIALPTLCVLALFRAGTSLVSVWLYSRYGLILVCWWSLLLQSRHLLALTGGS